MNTSIAHQPDATPDVPDQLNAAAAHIERHGLHKGEFISPDDPTGNCACTLGAIGIVTAEDCTRFWDADSVADEPATLALLSYLIDQPQAAVPIEPYLRFVNEPSDWDDGIWLENRLVDPVETVGGWNDAPERTAEQVVDTLRSAARWAGEQ